MQTVIEHAAAILGVRALVPEELADELIKHGVELGDDPVGIVGELLGDLSEFYLFDEAIVHVPSQLDGIVWCTTAVATPDGDEMLPVEPDLSLIGWWLMDGGVKLMNSDGTSLGGLVVVEDDDFGNPILVGPPGWLDELGDQLVTVRVVNRGLCVELAETIPNATTALADAVRAGFLEAAATAEGFIGLDLSDTALADERLATVSSVLWQALRINRAAFAGDRVPRIDDVIAAAGLERDFDMVAEAGFDWAQLQKVERIKSLAQRFGLDEFQAEMLAVALAGVEILSIDADALPASADRTEILAELAMCLNDPDISRAFVSQHTIVGTDPAALVDAALLVAGVPDRASRTGATVVAAWCLDMVGRAAEAEALLIESARGNDFGPILEMLAGYRADRGDAVGTIALLRRAEVDPDVGGPAVELLREVVGYAVRPAAMAGRNDRCPCGSGRKYKACHAGKERHALIDRAPWLYRKARRFVDVHGVRASAEAASTIAAIGRRRASDIEQLIDTGLVADIVLCEGGLLDDFCEQRDGFLPDDEAMLAARWVLVERSLFEVEHVQPDRIKLRDVRSGERIEVTNVHQGATQRGTMLLGRPLPVDDTWRAYSGFTMVSLPLMQHVLDALDSGDPHRVAEVIGRSFAPPTILNTDGEAIHFHTITWDVDDEQAAAAVLVGHGFSDEADGLYVLSRPTKNQPDALVASLRLAGTTLTAEVNSDERADEIILLVARLLPTASMAGDDSWGLGDREGDDDSDGDGADIGGGLSMDDPAVLSVMTEVMLKYEQRWLDDSIPALGGATPRQAAVDPVLRVDLERLLASLPGPGPGLPVAMSADRLRAELGL